MYWLKIEWMGDIRMKFILNNNANLFLIDHDILMWLVGLSPSQPIETFQQRTFWRSFRYRRCFYVWHCNRTWWRDIQMLNLISLCHRIIVFLNKSKKVFINGLKLFFQVQSLQQLSYFQKKNYVDLSIIYSWVIWGTGDGIYIDQLTESLMSPSSLLFVYS